MALFCCIKGRRKGRKRDLQSMPETASASKRKIIISNEATTGLRCMNKGCLNDIHEKCTKCKDENGKSCDFCADCWIQHGEQFPDHL
jgi:hypothetical protein